MITFTLSPVKFTTHVDTFIYPYFCALSLGSFVHFPYLALMHSESFLSSSYISFPAPASPFHIVCFIRVITCSYFVFKVCEQRMQLID